MRCCLDCGKPRKSICELPFRSVATPSERKSFVECCAIWVGWRRSLSGFRSTRKQISNELSHSMATTTAYRGNGRVALHTDAAVVPGYAVSDESLGKYRLRFEPPVELIRTGDMERDVVENTRKFTKVIEDIIRKYPDQWVWVHGRWNTRPKGEPPIYDFS